MVEKTNLTFFDIKWPTEVDMLLNSTQTPLFKDGITMNICFAI